MQYTLTAYLWLTLIRVRYFGLLLSKCWESQREVHSDNILSYEYCPDPVVYHR